MPHPVPPAQPRPRWWPVIPEACPPGEGMFCLGRAAFGDVLLLGGHRPGISRSRWLMTCGNVGWHWLTLVGIG